MRADPLGIALKGISGVLGQMCDYPELRIRARWADMGDMQQERLKSLVETGNYRPKPALIAEAMLRRRGVRELLADETTGLNPAGRIRSAQASGPQAA
jgi:hypothetical protein